jgi:hypothetical protein
MKEEEEEVVAAEVSVGCCVQRRLHGEQKESHGQHHDHGRTRRRLGALLC